MSEARPILLAAGGTGGHLFPAQALAVELARRGCVVDLVTDSRALRYGGDFPARAVHSVSAATPTGGSIVSKAVAVAKLARGTLEAVQLLRRLRPLCVVGFGGYPTAPPLFAASLLGVPAILHEQNAVMGRANRFLAGRVDQIATGFAHLKDAGSAIAHKCVHTGNPVRPGVIAAAAPPYGDFADGRLRLLVTGGSQGARVMSDVVPAAIALLPADLRGRLDLVQQARGEDEARVRAAYAGLGFSAEIAPFFADLPQRIAQAHLVVARAGASTVSELAVIGRPSILVPFPFALDQDQAANAMHLSLSGAATLIPQTDFTPERLASEIVAAFADPAGLTRRAGAAKSAGLPDAAARLADLVMRVAGASPPEPA
ncbi:MAG: UDP-N-acetylglucosamine--N-acetylmuramyl-(pentapeptide) pyrophosphoryl-undecaprenol [Hyphomicrobiales bacterium]|nr:UDP-N-acetylglucosamine--N-acetylmuramyl-(pentapeptide) pyrophosphoryl-undecaprenol [Hyphomicrobiales bacterium]